MTAVLAGAVLAAGLALALALTRGEPDTGKPTAAPADPGVRPAATQIAVTSIPTGARVTRNGELVGSITPVSIDVPSGDRVTLVLTKPGYAPLSVDVSPDDSRIVEARLEPVDGFEGIWRLADGRLRAFERRGARVAAFEVTEGGERTFLRHFEFTDTDPDSGAVTFAAAEEHVDERAANEPSCHIPLHAEYRYRGTDDRLELRNQEVFYDLHDGRCLNVSTEWGGFTEAERIAYARGEHHAISRAGAGTPDVEVEPEQPGDVQAGNDSPAQQKSVSKKSPVTKAPPAKRPPAGNQKPARPKVGRAAGAVDLAAEPDRAPVQAQQAK